MLIRDSKAAVGMSFVLVLLLIAAVGFAGYTVFKEDTDVPDTGDSSSVQKQTSDNTDIEQPIDSGSDLQAELDEIENIDLEAELDTSDLDAELDSF